MGEAENFVPAVKTNVAQTDVRVPEEPDYASKTARNNWSGKRKQSRISRDDQNEGAANDCYGTNSNGKGACVFYGKTEQTINMPAWLAHIQAASDCLAELETKKAERDIRAQEIKLLNNSLTDLLHLNSHTADTKQATGTNGTVGTHANQVQATEQQCEAAKDNKDECGKLEKHGCVYNPQGDSGKKCTLKPEAKAQLEKANQETEGKDGKMNQNVARRKQKTTAKKSRARYQRERKLFVDGLKASVRITVF
uniref:Variant surface glycoprotein 1125.5774 n=1 Tax=Trypanosoma brucei TaxID=5691 RepID=A0A1J0RD43_9TRYP|nr:variant surface glycoprotein 1125.5774 [Trypanosoma brucei]